MKNTAPDSNLALAITAASLANSLMQAVKPADIHSAFMALFTQFPKVAAYTWVQHTPYFNDGDPCVFSAYTEQGCRSMLDPSMAGSSIDWIVGTQPLREDITASRAVYNLPPDITDAEEIAQDGMGYYHPEFDDKNFDFGRFEYRPEGKSCYVGGDAVDMAARDKFSELFNSIPNKVLKSCFGDHVEIVVTRTGIGRTDHDGD